MRRSVVSLVLLVVGLSACSQSDSPDSPTSTVTETSAPTPTSSATAGEGGGYTPAARPWMPATVGELEAVQSTSLSGGGWTMGGDLRWEVVGAHPRPGDEDVRVEMAVKNLTGKTIQINTDTTQVAVVSGGALARDVSESVDGFRLQEEDPGNWAYDSTNLAAGVEGTYMFQFRVRDPQDLRVVVGVAGYEPVAFDTDEP